VLERIMEPGGFRAYEWQARQLATRRAAAITLAVRLYQLEHAGRVPEKLDALVPDYLPSVPRDPFAADDRPLQFRPAMMLEGFETPVVYSVGEDGTDGGASTRPVATPTSVSVFGNAWGREDLVFPLKTPPPVDRPPPQYEVIDLPTTPPATTEPSP
jgi:hypothetical protein